MRTVRKLRFFGLMGAVVATAQLTAACAGEQALNEGDGSGAGSSERIIVGSANFTEQLILGNMYALMLEDAGFKVGTNLNIGSREVVFPALQQGEIHVVPEYTGALTSYITKGEVTETNVDALVEMLRDELEPQNIAVLEPAPAQDRDALAVTRATAQKYDLQTVSDLAPVADQLVAGGPPEEKTRHVGLPGLKQVYGIEFADFKTLDAGGPLTAAALENGDIDVGRVFSTQGIIEQNNWVVLEEDKPLIPAEAIIPVVREEVLDTELEKALNRLSAQITTEDLTRLNAAVEVDKEDPEDVARGWLQDQGLL
jgi:osmoprotectant transport system substrate-binding protein